MQNSKASSQFHKGMIKYSIPARQKIKRPHREHEESWLCAYVCFVSEAISLVSLASKSTFRDPFFQNPCLRSPFCGIHFLGIHVSESLSSEPILSGSLSSKSNFLESLCSESIFSEPIFPEFISGTWAKMRISENSCVSFLCGYGEHLGIHVFGATHFGVLDFWREVAPHMEFHVSIQFVGGGGGFVGGGVCLAAWLGF